MGAKNPVTPAHWGDDLNGVEGQTNGGAQAAPGAGRPRDGVDWNFVLNGSEGKSSTDGYFPLRDDTSGVTVGQGVDLGSVSRADLQRWGASQGLVDTLSPYLGKRGADARAFLNDPNDLRSGFKRPFAISPDDAKLLTDGARQRTVGDVARVYESATGKNFQDLAPEKQTVLVDIAHQTGPTGLRTSFAHGQFWQNVMDDDWRAARTTLQTMKSDFRCRRDREAGLLSRY